MTRAETEPKARLGASRGPTGQRDPVDGDTQPMPEERSGDALPRAQAWINNTDGWGITILTILAAVFMLEWARKFFIPLVLGMTLAFTLNPIVVWLERFRLPRAAGASLLILTLVGSTVVATMSLRDQMVEVLDQVPDAAAKLSTALREMSAEPNTIQKMQDAARQIEQATKQAADGEAVPKKPQSRIVVEQPKFHLSDMIWASSLGMFGFLGDSVMLLFLVFFLLLSGEEFKRKCLRLAGPSLSEKKITVNIIDDIGRSVQYYMLTMLATNMLLAVSSWVAFHALGLQNAGAWAVAAGVLHFIPYLGPALTALGVAMAAFMQFEGIEMAVLAGTISLGLATIVGTLILPWLNSKTGKMNATAIFISLLFWGWLWGAWGMLLAIPIMGMIKVLRTTSPGWNRLPNCWENEWTIIMESGRVAAFFDFVTHSLEDPVARSRRPELEKDNPIAPQPRTSRRRISGRSNGGMISAGEALELLTHAAERFVDGAPRVKKLEAERQALLDAITSAQLVLSVHRFKSTAHGEAIAAS
jgi:predicted PurR-regulated permease PerM